VLTDVKNSPHKPGRISQSEFEQLFAAIITISRKETLPNELKVRITQLIAALRTQLVQFNQVVEISLPDSQTLALKPEPLYDFKKLLKIISP
jgi:hypothetical protein